MTVIIIRFLLGAFDSAFRPCVRVRRALRAPEFREPKRLSLALRDLPLQLLVWMPGLGLEAVGRFSIHAPFLDHWIAITPSSPSIVTLTWRRRQGATVGVPHRSR